MVNAAQLECSRSRDVRCVWFISRHHIIVSNSRRQVGLEPIRTYIININSCEISRDKERERASFRQQSFLPERWAEISLSAPFLGHSQSCGVFIRTTGGFTAQVAGFLTCGSPRACMPQLYGFFTVIGPALRRPHFTQ